MPTSSTVRTLSGRVTDTSNEPIRGAVVELRNERSNEVVTYITDASGNYNFKRLEGNSDYDVRVLFRGRHSATRTISKFDSHMAKVLNFSVRTY
jgi:protocatechuate 3,4-dioxygenase beta subunit